MSIIKFLFSSLFSNQTVIYESKKKPWWLAVLVVILSFAVAIVPNVTSVMKTNGSELITTNENYNLDYSLQTFSKNYLYAEEGATPKTKAWIENQTMHWEGEGATAPIEIFYQTNVTLLIQFVEGAKTAEDLSSTITDLKAKYPLESDAGKSSIKSMLFFTPTSLYLYFYNHDATCTFTMNNGHAVLSASSDPVKTFSANYKSITNASSNLNAFYNGSLPANEANASALASWKVFFDDAYKSPRNQYALTTSGMYLGFDAIVILVMSLTIFLLSKSKNSIRKYSFLESIKMVFFASLSPAIIALLLGMLMPSFQMVGFILCLGLRITWLGMKATSPGASAGAVRK